MPYDPARKSETAHRSGGPTDRSNSCRLSVANPPAPLQGPGGLFMPRKPGDETAPFDGFTRPNYTIVPDELFDRLLHQLSGAELKVLLYIIRRTFGFKKDSDRISLKQMAEGIRTRDG